jgi:hypothetical protein
MSALVAIPENKEIVFGDELRKKARRELKAKWKNEFMRRFRRDERTRSIRSSSLTTTSIMDLHAAMQLSNINVELDGTTTASIIVNENGDISVNFS